MVITDETTGISQLLGARARAPSPKVYTYASYSILYNIHQEMPS